MRSIKTHTVRQCDLDTVRDNIAGCRKTAAMDICDNVTRFKAQVQADAMASVLELLGLDAEGGEI